MLRYMNFLWATLFKRVFVYVLLGVYAVIMLGIMYLFTSLGSSGGGVTPVSFTSYPNSFIAWFAFIFCTLFMCLVVIHVFKKQETEGTELLISAKPISRTNIVFGKIFVVLLALFGFAVVSFVVFFAGALMDKHGTNTRALKYASGLFLGIIITGLLFTSIILLFGTILKKTGLMVISTLIPVGIFVLNMSAVPVTGAIVPVIRDDGYSSSQYSKIYNDNGTMKVENIYVDNSEINRNINSKYKTLKYFDLWGQWNNSFLIVQPMAKEANSQSGFYLTSHLQSKVPNSKDLITATGSDGNDYAISPETIEMYVPSISVAVYNDVVKHAQLIINDSSTQPTQSLNDDIEVIYNAINKLRNPIIYDFLKDDRNDDKAKEVKNVITSEMFKVSKYKDGTYDPEKNGNNSYFINVNTSKITSKDAVMVTGVKPFLNTTYVNIFWIIIALGLTGLAILIYLRRDFK